MLSPRIFWLASHQTLRYEEVPLLIEAGAEVIPCLGETRWLKYDNNYDNESDKLYPNWRKSCTLPTNIVEKIRRIQLDKKKGIVSDDEAKFINRWVDVIYVASFVDILANILKWFQGYIVFRVFGLGDITTYTKVMNDLNIDLDIFDQRDKYVWAPILNGLEDCEDPRVVKNKFYLNGFVSKERLGYEWKGTDSKSFFSTNISYLLDGNVAAIETFENMIKEFSDMPFIVLGKNPKDALDDISDKVLGHVDDSKFYSTMAESRMFVYTGYGSNYHLHFTPVEAITMGVPVIFLEKSGLAQEARDNGISNETLKTIGMCTDIQQMKEFVLKSMNDFQELYRIAHEQSNVLGKIFSREAALRKTKDFFEKIQPYIQSHRKIKYDQSTTIDLVHKECFRTKSIQRDLPTEPGERVNFSSEEIGTFTGKLIYDNQGKFIAQRVEEGLDIPGLLLSSYLWKMYPGEYLFSLVLDSFKDYDSPVGSLSVGVWNPNHKIIGERNINKVTKGKNIINLIIKISPQDSDLIKEMRVVWNGAPTCEISNIIVEKLR